MPYTSQPPLYPVLIASLGVLFPISFTDAALLIPVISYGLLMLISYQLVNIIYDQRIALLVVVFLHFYQPIRRVSSRAWSEPVAVLLVMITMLLLVREHKSRPASRRALFFAGLSAGLAFTTRYAMAPIPIVGGLALIKPDNRKQTLEDISLFLLGFALPTGLVLGRNFIVSGGLRGQTPNPSTVGLVTVLESAFWAVFGRYLGVFPPRTEVILVALTILIAASVTIYRDKSLVSVNTILIKNNRFMITVWSISYMTMIIVLRTRYHFDNIGERLIFPAGITLFFLWIALLIHVIPVKFNHLVIPAVVLVGVAVIREAQTIANTPVYDPENWKGNNDRLEWLAQNTTERDLLIGESMVEVPFYLGRKSVVSFSPYPYSDYPEYKKIVDFALHHCPDYEKIYIVIAHRFDDENSWSSKYGSFITDLVSGRTEKYPEIIPIQNLNGRKLYPFRVLCP